MDRVALTEIYYATGGPNWSNNTNWLGDGRLDEWHGVTADASGRVIELDLGGNGLAGTIPPELGNLVNLQKLILQRNQLSGTIRLNSAI